MGNNLFTLEDRVRAKSSFTMTSSKIMKAYKTKIMQQQKLG